MFQASAVMSRRTERAYWVDAPLTCRGLRDLAVRLVLRPCHRRWRNYDGQGWWRLTGQVSQIRSLKRWETPVIWRSSEQRKGWQLNAWWGWQEKDFGFDKCEKWQRKIMDGESSTLEVQPEETTREEEPVFIQGLVWIKTYIATVNHDWGAHKPWHWPCYSWRLDCPCIFISQINPPLLLTSSLDSHIFRERGRIPKEKCRASRATHGQSDGSLGLMIN